MPDEVPVPLELFAPEVPLLVLLLEPGAPKAFVPVDEFRELIPGLVLLLGYVVFRLELDPASRLLPVPVPPRF